MPVDRELAQHAPQEASIRRGVWPKMPIDCQNAHPLAHFAPDDVIYKVDFYQDKDEFLSLYPEEVTPTESRPAAVLLYGGALYPRPVPDASYTFKAACIKKPTALTASTAPTDLRHGLPIAYGTAIEMFMEDNDTEAADKLAPVYQYFLGKVNQKKMTQEAVNQRAAPRF